MLNQAIPPLPHRCWQRLASGNLGTFQTRQLGIQLLLKRLHSEPISPMEKAAQVHAFFVKYEKILASEISQLSSL